ncbi:Coenzyme F420 hydrogenase/dehydrogenase, beta subunit C-terminal domain [Eubacterium sp. ER2]|uniref:Coenzyme F420 hydrogenase/dehydrogenase, beta subunit C-terminal domain n=1 Tax=Eubacterium sp. ER2 TaxID=1519438 RepID=UPI0018CF326C|nr:Coenzyme F420 hydrogenase/dehydrogenase, beta subunit C-terminal domain [Eubacterium sp. ER2]
MREDECCGCTACKSICPKNAITLQPNREGFLYPQVNTEICVDCSQCVKVCDFQHRDTETKTFGDYPHVLAVRHRNKEVVECSTSGGAFTGISDFVLNRNGVVYGATIDNDFVVKHIRAVSESDRNKLRGSKYVQSDLGGSFGSVKRDLDNGIEVLFTGTPCQCAGVKSYLERTKTSMDKLIICDFVCHGTPSPRLWKEHVASLQRRYKKKIEYYQFRPKVNGWRNHTEAVVLKDGKKVYKPAFIQKHKQIFYSHLALRKSCYNCKYTSIFRDTELTIADCWGIEKKVPEWNDDRGVSLVLINNKKGEKIFDSIKDNFEYRQIDIKDFMQPQLQHPANKPKQREEFWNEYYQHGYKFIVKKYTTCNFKDEIILAVINLLRRTGMINIVKKIIRR